jgi:hypothetical protein
MFHACAAKFDETKNLKPFVNFLTKQGLSLSKAMFRKLKKNECIKTRTVEKPEGVRERITKSQ